MLILTWFERSLHSAQVSGQKFPLPLKLMTSQAEEGMWIHTGGYRRLRGEWVNRVSTRITSLLLAVWASTVTATSKNVTMITFGLNLPLSSLTLFRPGLFYASRYPGGGGVSREAPLYSPLILRPRKLHTEQCNHHFQLVGIT